MISLRYLIVAILLHSSAVYSLADYDPLQIDAKWQSQPIDLTFNDSSRKREIPLRVFLPKSKEPAAVILFSHGLGGSREGNPYLGKHWSARGYAVVFMQHHGSDNSVWQEAPLRERLSAMKNAANYQNTLNRFQDVPAVIDQLELWSTQKEHPLYQRLDLSKLGMSGHSYGAVTTQAVSGQWAPLLGQKYTDQRIKAAVIMSPSLPKRGDESQVFAKVKVPWFLMTGTKDEVSISSATPEQRMRVYSLVSNKVYKYGLVLHDAEHHAFGDSRLGSHNRNPKHHPAILALSTAFWDFHLLDNQAAAKWLHGKQAATVLDKKDRWEINTPNG